MTANAQLRERFSRIQTDALSEAEVALLVGEVAVPGADRVASRSRVDNFLGEVAAAPAQDAATLLKRFRDHGFGTPRQVDPAPELSELGWVVEHRQGIPISLAVLLIEGARRCGLASHGINYPGHFLVSLEACCVDPVTMSEVPAGQLDSDPSLRHQATPAMIGLRMLNNLKALRISQGDWSGALDLIDLQLAIAGSDPALAATLHFERGEYWQQVGAFAAAREAFATCTRLSTDGSLRATAARRASELGGSEPTLH